MPRTTALPWGLSLAAGIIFAVMSLSPHLNVFNPMATSVSSPLPSKIKVLKTGEIPVDILNASRILVIASKQADGEDGNMIADKRKAPLLAPHAGEGKWMKVTDMPTARCPLNSASTVNGKIYVIGGALWAMDQVTSAVEQYDPITDAWTRKTDMPTPRGFLSTSVVNGRIYAIGGSDDANYLSTVEEYDPARDKWTKKADMPTARSALSTSVVNDKIYAIGGFNVISLSVVEEYDPVEDKWTPKADMPTARNAFSTSTVDDRIYAIGGQAPGVGPGGGPILPIVEEYDPAMDKWTQKADMPTARATLCTSAVDGRIYAIGGLGNQFFQVVEEYDPIADEWVKKPDMPTGRADLSATTIGGKIYTIGGTQTWPLSPLSTVEVYDTGFVPPSQGRSIKLRGKLPTTWGMVRRRENIKIQ